MFAKTVVAASIIALASAAALKRNDAEVYYLTDCYTSAVTGNYSGGSYYSSFSGSLGGNSPEVMGPIIGGSLHSLQKWEGNKVRIAMMGDSDQAPGTGIFDATIAEDARSSPVGKEVGSGTAEREDRAGWAYTCYKGDESKVLYVQEDAECKGTYYCMPHS